MVEKNLTHHQVRRDVYLGVSAGANSFCAHTFCEVFVGGRWRRLNYTSLGQNVLHPTTLGLMIKVNTFNDLSDANLAATWGTRYAKGLRDDVFQHSNPYTLVEISDHFGQYAKVPNPPAVNYEHKQITIDRAYWPESKDAPPGSGHEERGKTRRTLLLDSLPGVVGERRRLPAIQAIHEPSRQELHPARRKVSRTCRATYRGATSRADQTNSANWKWSFRRLNTPRWP